MKGTSGRVSYGDRAFHQDATEAMGGDIRRGLIELITNSDDAYGSKEGKIFIEVEHRRGPWKVVTRDRAKGMSPSFIRKAIANLGETTSGFAEGADVRGNLGRGAKDLAAFGRVEFESIFDDEYVHMSLDPYGCFKIDDSERANEQNREKLGIKRGNGTVVTVHVLETIRCPQHAKLVNNLSKHYQLRDIMSDPKREVILFDINNGQKDTLRFSRPPLPVVVDEKLTIDGYPKASARLTINRNEERYDDPPSDPTRPNGILIKGKRAIYENTLFSYENNPYSGWFSGRIECPYIDDLARDYDKRLADREPHTDDNPIPIITRRRDGLQKSHPFYKALAAAVEKYLAKCVADEEKKFQQQTSTESVRLRRRLDGLGRELSKLIDEDLREIEEETLPADTPDIKLIPEDVVLYMQEDKTVSVMINNRHSADKVYVKCDPEGVAEILDGSSIPLFPHKRRPDLLAGQIHLRPILEDQAMLTVECAGFYAVALLEVRPKRPIVEIEEHAVDHFQFEKEHYRIAWTKRKQINILAPLSDIAVHGTSAKVSSSNPGLVVRTGRIVFKLDEELEQYAAAVEIEGRSLQTRATIRATLGDIVTTCGILVTKDENPNLIIKVVDKEAGNYRSILQRDEKQLVIEIMGRHPIIKRLRGPASENFPGNDSPATQAVIAEIVADTVVRMIMEKKFPDSLNEKFDAARFYVEHYAYMSKYLPRCHSGLLYEKELYSKAQAPSLLVAEPLAS